MAEKTNTTTEADIKAEPEMMAEKDNANAEPEKATEAKTELSKRSEFSSEMFKIHLSNIPAGMHIGQIKKMLKKWDIDYHKLKPTGAKNKYMYINFANDEDRNKAIDKLDGLEYRGRVLKAQIAQAAKDPFLKKKEDDEPEDTRPTLVRLMEAVCPLSGLPYEEQVQKKFEKCAELMKGLSQEVMKGLSAYKIPNFNLTEDNIAVVEPVLRSPVTAGYRNKCEFTVGSNPETKEILVGFRLGKYKAGIINVATVDDIPIVSDEMKQVARMFQDFVTKTGLPPYNICSQEGYWKHITVRSNRKNEVMVIGVIRGDDLTDARKISLGQEFSEAMTAAPDKANIVSVYLQFTQQMKKGNKRDGPLYTHISGQERLQEDVLGAKFSISPGAFFQVNVQGAELLFKTIGDLVNLDPESSTVLDVCCGTGTIGICLATRCKKVIGVDIIESAVDDANQNVKENGLTNAKFMAGRAEHLLDRICREHASPENTVAIVDPPRAGLHPKAVHAIRSSKIQKLVYISCDANAAMGNFNMLTRPPSKTLSGDPFIPTKVIPVDLFPQTNHFETILIFERFPMTKLILEEL
ncbi:hypothetical protein TCAL_07467 [Tigriopus californicus]|uniref:tRNA (uracil(54)-C(5))-methyltransferase n=1 Tax=Tigriopus californicus TaxID=6832 RepID=A0A553NS28_TIGCA|nr:tRNA (uracil-5-)-methyltransferase homolog A-like [Tigriopus californicus]TRY68241.1 hypothetical protein TCAL_07467 [Tigriopus californicus]|eukprot:TCALIF_07467-PB protein Name:"Similar to TRMT2A tRNA (uracil-5-)-methyltransferase homolog A (Homo sapiens)" AED:0.05 eAED:0.05 QI:1564/1/1/1/1/0.85/7/69/578